MCTALSMKIKDGNYLFGRNMDNYFSFNEQIIIVPKNYNITFKNETNIESHYAIIGIGTIIDNYPLFAECANEKGLAIAALSFKDNAIYYKKEKDKINLAPYEIMLYLLATCKNIKEVKSVLKRVNIINESFKKDVLLTDLHFMVSDLNESIVIETTAFILPSLSTFLILTSVICISSPPQKLFKINIYRFSLKRFLFHLPRSNMYLV